MISRREGSRLAPLASESIYYSLCRRPDDRYTSNERSEPSSIQIFEDRAPEGGGGAGAICALRDHKIDRPVATAHRGYGDNRAGRVSRAPGPRRRGARSPRPPPLSSTHRITISHVSQHTTNTVRSHRETRLKRETRLVQKFPRNTLLMTFRCVKPRHFLVISRIATCTYTCSQGGARLNSR